ncbi:UDP-N-acetylmuramoyl-L-alanyl-D-glutamate--2,6-diaminopimelate ligase [Anaerococcus sp. AGMB09787]|uniref:UDP-N-acetylmuramoyl-L-alanyl-D-glutamate--2, 6-diaminopimelate ligase n=1 Tax=Anaerococcus sp. AGMB09787 TaxID=2922869 RepID=UPI001FB02F58|nr:UDP-N-acetylmuramoyl-L-alanyl-D-glutamate--2,6-diaminopimelate ligase [Anaerococcus sp. AGMB09787]
MKRFRDLLENIDHVSYVDAGNFPINYVNNNSKKIGDNDIFVAVKGSLADGHKYIDSAIEAGSKIIVHQDEVVKREGISYIRVGDSRKALAQVSNFLTGNPSSKINMVAVTGSNGKTTTSRLISYLTSKLVGKSGSIGTNNAILDGELIPTANTTPDICEINLILEKALAKGIENMAIEASSHGLSQKRLYGVDIDYGIFTNLSEEHLDYHKTMENYFEAKMILFDQAKHTIANIDDSYGKRAKDLYPDTITFAINNEEADFRAENLVKEDNKIKFSLRGVDFTLNTIADYEVYNTLAAASLLSLMGYPMEDIRDGVESFPGIKSRFEYIENNLGINIILDFAHTPRAFEAVFRAVPDGIQKIAVFGINGDRNRNFRKLIGRTCADNHVLAVLTTDDPKFDKVQNINGQIIEGIEEGEGQYVVREDRDKAMEYAFSHADKGAYVFLLGKGEENFIKFKGNEKTPYSERETIREVLGRL